MDKTPSFELPGFRFHPTEEELLEFYLKNIIHDRKMQLNIIGFLNIYRFDPWDLPGLAKIGEREWYFFVPRDRKHSNGGRPNRTTQHGFWKATGSDRKIVSLSEPKRVIGLRKTLVFYQGRAPRGTKTDWIMNEFRLPDNYPLPKDKDIVLCKIYRKATSLKELEQRAAKEEENSTMTLYPPSPISSSNETHSIFGGYSSGTSASGQLQDLLLPTMHMISALKREENLLDSSCNNNHNVGVASNTTSNTIQVPFGKESIELQVPKSSTGTGTGTSTGIGTGTSTGTGTGMDWDSLCPLSCSPWFESLLNLTSPTLISQIL